jgi:hypothetical protein
MRAQIFALALLLTACGHGGKPAGGFGDMTPQVTVVTLKEHPQGADGDAAA